MTAAPALTACLSRAGRPKVGYRFGRRLLRAARLTSRETGQPVRWYLCGCGWWHVTSQPEAISREEKARRIAALERLEARQ